MLKANTTSVVNSKNIEEILIVYKNEEIILSKSNNNPSRVNVVTYNLYKPNKHLNKIILSSDKLDNSKWKSSIQLFSSSMDKINNLGIRLDSKITSSSLYKDYKKIIHESNNGKLDDETLFNINPKLKNKVYRNTDLTYYQTNLDNYILTVCSVNKTKDLDNLSLAKFNKDGELLELLDILDLSQANNKIRKSYNLPKNINKVYLLSISSDNLDTLKNMLEICR